MTEPQNQDDDISPKPATQETSPPKIKITPAAAGGAYLRLALSPEVRPPAEPVPIWAYNIKLSTNHAHTQLSN